MGYRLRRSLACLALMLAIASPLAAQETEPPHWTYEGDAGPAAWGSLDEAYALCATGAEQSPIDLANAEAFDLVNVQTDYHTSALTILNNGHTIQANYDAGSSIVVNQSTYALAQFHFHTPSEHSIDGEQFPMEAHFVHRSADGALAVIGVMLIEGEADNAAFAPVFDAMPAEAGEPIAVENVTLDVNAMLPTDPRFYTYRGSLTTPPCSEGVRWIVMTTPVEVSAAQLAAFQALFAHNARPVQPVLERGLLIDTAG